MLLEIYHHDALPSDNIVGESSQGFSNVWGLVREGGGDVGGGAGVEGGGGQVLTLSDLDPRVENIINIIHKMRLICFDVVKI